jgi:hypothetical protein
MLDDAEARNNPENPQAGNGKVPNAIFIRSAADMALIGTSTRYPLDGDYALQADITLSRWTPIGTNTAPFTGTFDGTGLASGDPNFTITVTDFEKTSLTGQYLGIFGYVASTETGSGTISNLNVVADIAQYSDSTGNQYVGGLVGQANKGVVLQNIAVSGSIRFAAENVLALGGIAGALEGASLINTSSTPVSSLDITTTASNTIYAGVAVGYGGNTPKITGVKTSGNVWISNGMIDTSAGGLSGYTLEAVITDCHASGTITIDFHREAMVYAGGLAGYAGGGTITKSHASGDVSASSNYPYAGGLVGYNYKGNVVTESYATGTVKANTNVEGGGYSYAGGLAGYNSGTGSTIQNCYATGAVLANSITKTGWAGGITGSNASGALIDCCYATGAIEVKTPRLINPEAPLDGAVAGGIVGFNYTGTATVRNSAGLNPSITAGRTTDTKLHRIAGQSDTPAVLSNNIGSTSMVFNPPYTPVPGQEKVDGADTDAQPQKNVYVAVLQWDFNTTWEMTDGVNDYPLLKWQVIPASLN